MAKACGYRRIEVETNSKNAVDIIVRRGNEKMDMNALVVNIKQEIAKFEPVEIHHNFREVNMCAPLAC